MQMMRLRLAELVAAWSLAIDLGLGLPQEHVLRQCRIALGLGERLGLDEAERAAVYYVAMLAWVGCTADSHELADQFGDEIAFRADAHQVDLAGLPMMGFMLRRVGSGRPPLRRAQMAAALVATGGRDAAEAMTAHCQVAAAIARRLGLGPEVQDPLLHVFSRWDGRGIPAGRPARSCRWRSGSSTSPPSPRSTTAMAASTRRSRSRAIAPGDSSTRVWWRRSPTAPASCSTGWRRSRAGTR